MRDSFLRVDGVRHRFEGLRAKPGELLSIPCQTESKRDAETIERAFWLAKIANREITLTRHLMPNGVMRYRVDSGPAALSA